MAVDTPTPDTRLIPGPFSATCIGPTQTPRDQRYEGCLTQDLTRPIGTQWDPKHLFFGKSVGENRWKYGWKYVGNQFLYPHPKKPLGDSNGIQQNGIWAPKSVKRSKCGSTRNMAMKFAGSIQIPSRQLVVSLCLIGKPENLQTGPLFKPCLKHFLKPHTIAIWKNMKCMVKPQWHPWWSSLGATVAKRSRRRSSVPSTLRLASQDMFWHSRKNLKTGSTWINCDELCPLLISKCPIWGSLDIISPHVLASLGCSTGWIIDDRCFLGEATSHIPLVPNGMQCHTGGRGGPSGRRPKVSTEFYRVSTPEMSWSLKWTFQCASMWFMSISTSRFASGRFHCGAAGFALLRLCESSSFGNKHLIQGP